MTGPKKVQRHYDEVAEIYDRRYTEGTGQSYHQHISDQVMGWLPPHGRLLDIGCGTGLFVERYIERGGQGIGLDISQKMIERGRDRAPSADWTVGTGESLPFQDNTFDAVSSLLAFSYFKDPQGMLAEVYRVLRPGGRVALCTLGRNFLTAGLPAIHTLGELARVRQVGMGSFGEHYYSDAEMEALFAGASFVDVRVKRCSFAHLNLARPVYHLARRIEPIVEKRLPYLAYNICATGRKPHP
ncbi:MAG: class I SAM-dependent methyltransferase [Methanoregulaceae archaeon]